MSYTVTGNTLVKNPPISGTKKAVKAIASLAQTYAQQQNSKYNSEGSVYVNLDKRFNDTISNLPRLKQQGIRAQLIAACKEFSKKYPNVTKFSDLELCEAGLTPMSDTLIDITIQRLLDLSWVVEILKNFREVQADPIKLYEVIDGGDLTEHYPVGAKLYGSWDAQHTAIVFWIIATMITMEDPRTVLIPSIVYKVKNRADIRENFVKGNSKEGKHLLDSIDLFMQMVMGVRLDGSNNPKWVEAERKQRHLEDADLFVTAEKFGNTHMPGAISRMAEIDKYTSDVIRKFCLYTTTFPAPRSIDSQEIEIMCGWFDLAKNSGIDYTDAEVVDLGNHIHALFGADFHESSEFWVKVRQAYANWHIEYYKKIPKKDRPNSRMAKNWNSGGTFLWHQLKKTWTGAIPALSNSTPFIPKQSDLY
jgi:hypothetical protein